MSAASPAGPQGVPFSFFVSLLREISHHCPRKALGLRRDQRFASYPALGVLSKWIARLRSDFAPLPEGTTAIVFRLLFPEEDTRRKYEMQETRLAAALADCFGISATPLRQWSADGSTGCLGEEVLNVANKSSSYAADYIGLLSIAEVDTLLDELASHSGYSDVSVRTKHPHATRRSRTTIIRALYRSLAPLDAAFLTQIILKDLRPLLYPLTETHYTAALKSFNSLSVTQLTKEDAMKAWDPSRKMLHIYRVRSRLDDASTAFDAGITGTVMPVIGIPVEIPKSEKGRGCLLALEMLQSSTEVWAETKYDGERAQIHVDIVDNRSRITIFSKSKRDSTLDRYGIHETIRRALGLPKNDGLSEGQRITKVILDAEMVAWHGEKIDEFWRIRSLVEHTARGVRAAHKQLQVAIDNYSQASLMTDVSDDRHLGLVFFDILLLNSTSLLSVPYSSRRAILESVIKTIPGRAILADRTRIAIIPNDSNPPLQHVFAQCLARPEEGLVLKAGEASYNDKRYPWVKLKRDYIPGYGDCVDLVVLGVLWEKDRGRELGVAPSAYTTFYIGGLHNAERLKRDPSARPHFNIYFTASYGLSRDALEEAIFLVKSSDAIPYDPSNPPHSLPFTFSILPGLVPPTAILREPLLAELFGAGFTKSPGSRYYQLRFPRITKIFRTRERSWQDAITLQDLHQVARECIGRDRSDKDVDDWCNRVWGKQVSPGITGVLKRKSVANEWEEKLIASDRKLARKRGWNSFASRILNNQARAETESPVPSRPRLLGSRTNLRASRAPSFSLLIGQAFPSPLALPAAYPSPSSSAFLVRPNKEDQPPETPKECITDVLSNSLVFMDVQNPIARRKWKLKIPRERIVHSLESLFIGCGWTLENTQLPSSRVQRGVIILDNEAEAEFIARRSSIFNAVQEREELCSERSGRKGIHCLQRNLADGGVFYRVD